MPQAFGADRAEASAARPCRHGSRLSPKPFHRVTAASYPADEAPSPQLGCGASVPALGPPALRCQWPVPQWGSEQHRARLVRPAVFTRPAPSGQQGVTGSWRVRKQARRRARARALAVLRIRSTALAVALLPAAVAVVLLAGGATGHFGAATGLGPRRAGSSAVSRCSSCSLAAAGRRWSSRAPGPPSAHRPDRRGVGPRSLPPGARPRRPARRPRALRHSAHPGLRQLAGGPHAPRPTARRRRGTGRGRAVRHAARPRRPSWSSARPFLWWMRVAELRALLAPVVAGTGPSAHPDIAAARRFVRGLDAAVAVAGPRPGPGARTPRSRFVGRVARLLLRGCREHAAEMERGVAAAASERAQAVDYGLRIVAQEQVGLAYAGWDRLLTRVALPAWRMGRWPSRLDAGVVSALTELSRRDRLAEGFASRLGERPACDLLEEPGADRRGRLAAGRPPLPRRPGRAGPRLVPGGLAAVPGGGRGPEVAPGGGPPPPRPRRPPATALPAPRRPGGPPRTPPPPRTSRRPLRRRTPADRSPADPARRRPARGAPAAGRRRRPGRSGPGPDAGPRHATGSPRTSGAGDLRRRPAQRGGRARGARGGRPPGRPRRSAQDAAVGAAWATAWPTAVCRCFPLQPPRTGRELLADHVTAMVCCAAVDTAGAAPGLDWLDGPALLVDGDRRGRPRRARCSAWSRTATRSRCAAG